MVSGTRFDGGGGTQILSARVRKTIQSIKEIVGNHSDADIYVTLKESDMDPNETTQKLLNQDPFHEVKRKRDKKKENSGYKDSAEPRKQAEHTVQDTKSQPFPNRNSRRGGFTRNALPGTSREFRIVRDNRVNQNTNREFKPVSNQCSTSTSVQSLPNVSEKSSRGVQTDPKGSSVRNSDSLKSSPSLYGPSDASSRHARDATSRHARDATSSRTPGKELHEETRASVLIPGSRVQGPKSHHSQPHSASLATTSSVVGVYSSSSDPVHVPSPDSRSSGNVGAIKREVGVVGVRRQPSENSPKNPSVPSSSFSTSFLGKDLSAPSESIQTSTVVTKNDQHGQATVPEPVISNVSVSKSFLSNQYSNKPYQQPVGHQKAPQANMEWKPKSSQKSSVVSPGIIGTSATSILPAVNNSSDSTKEVDHLEEKLSRVNVFENQHVIIPQHLRVPESDRTHLIFGSFGAGFDSTESFASGSQALGNALHLNGDPSTSVSASSTSSEDVNQVDLLDDPVRNSGSDSASAAASEHLLPEQKESSSPGNLENYVDIGLVRNTSPAYTPAEPQQQQDPAGLSSFAAYDPQTGYDMPFFRPTMEESLRGQGLPSQQEALSSHAANSIPASTVAMMQQQPVAQLYPQVHLSHYPNFMPYRQILSPVYVPPMAVPGYSNNPSYPHPSNGSSYLLMPGSNSHLAAGGLKYGTSQYKPVPAGNPTGFGSYTNQTGYAINAQGAIGGSGLEDSTRMKYKEGNLYIPNPQAETSEIWIQTPRELPGMQSQYYNLPTQQQQHAAYLQSHTGHASFNAAAPQSSHVQFPGLYHPSQQPNAIANPHHMVPGMGGNVGVGVAAAAPGAQVGAYQQPQMGHHLNWTTNF